MQDDDDMLPADGLYVPDWHKMQTICLDDGLYVPAGQLMHDDDDELPLDGLYDPAVQLMHADDDVLPTDGLNEPAGQAMHIICL